MRPRKCPLVLDGSALCAMMLVAAGARAQDGVAHSQVVTPAQHMPTLADIPQLRQFSHLAVSADGRWVAYVVSPSVPMQRAEQIRHPSDSADTPRIVLLDLGTNRRMELRVSAPPRSLRWSPSGPTLAFLAAWCGKSRIWTYHAMDSGPAAEMIAVSDSLDGSIVALAWSPTGDTLAYLAAESRAPADNAKDGNAVPEIVLFHDTPGAYTEPTLPSYARDSAGAYVALAVPGAGATQVLARHLVSSGIRPELDWSLAGTLLISGAPIGVGYLDKITQRLLYLLDPRTGAHHQLRPKVSARFAPSWSPTGRWLAYLKEDFLPDTGPPASYALQVERLEHESPVLTLTSDGDGLAITFRPVWGADDGHIYVARYRDGTARLYSIDLISRAWQALTPDTLSVSRYAISRDGSVVLAVLESANQPPELFRVDIQDGILTQLTHENDAIRAVRLGHVSQLSWRSHDGRFTIHGFLVEPPDFVATRRYPLVVQIHGGPGAFYTNNFAQINFASQIAPAQLLAAAGYLVLLPNPRGDPSYGPDFRAAIRGDWGPGPFGDIDAGVSALIERGFVDSTEVGIAGHSYGGYLTAYSITRTSRYGAASINDGPVNLESEYGQNYAIHARTNQWYFGGTPWAKSETYAEQSPIRRMSRVRTPVLMRYGGMSSTGDGIRQSYMLAQGFELYAALSDIGVPVQFVLHPAQGHVIDDWSIYQEWVTRNLHWFDYWLRNRGSNPLNSPQ